MLLIDLSQPLCNGMPVYPGSEPPVFETAATVDQDSYAEKRMVIFSHTGTHLDAPSHIQVNGMSLDRLALECFAGSATVLDFSFHPGPSIEIDDLTPYRYGIESSDFVLLKTGWSRHWGKDAYFSGYPVLSGNAADWLCDFRLKGIGLDAISVDTPGDVQLPVHRRLLGRGMVIIENLNHLDALPQSGFSFLALPLPIQDGDGSPVRAVAVLC